MANGFAQRKPFHSDYAIIGQVVKDLVFFEKQTLLLCVLPKQLFDSDDFPTACGGENGFKAASFWPFFEHARLANQNQRAYKFDSGSSTICVEYVTAGNVTENDLHQ